MDPRNFGSFLGVLRKNSYALAIVVVLAIFAVFLHTAVLDRVLSESVLQDAVTESTSRTDAMYEGVSGLLDDSDFTQINGESDKGSAQYQELQAHLNEIRNMNSTRYFYTAKRAEDGTLVYVVDGLNKDAADFRNPGDPIEEEMIPFIERAMSGETVYSQDIVDTDWGHIFTACYPVKASGSDEVIGALCIETDMEQTYTFIDEHQRTIATTAAVSLLILIALIALIYLFLSHFRVREERDKSEISRSNQKLKEALELQTQQYEIISSLAKIYTAIFQVDLRTKHYEIIESPELMLSVSEVSDTLDNTIEGILSTFVEPDMREDMREFLNLDTLSERLAESNTVVLEYRNPEGRWYQARYIVKKRDGQGNAIEALYVARDFTDEKKRELDLQNQLRDAAMEARRANVSKTTFLRRMSHDIRTPLNGIIGMIHVAERYRDNPEKMQECKDKILHSADYLIDLVNNVLDISKLESGSLVLEHKPFNLSELLLKSLPTVEANAMEHGIAFTGGTADSHIEHRLLVGSATHLNRILMNIASNAVKYNRPGGSVCLYANEIACDGERAIYEFVCEDTGLGMSKEFLQHAFEPFTREGKATTTSFSGSGLGLSIVKDVVEKMGGTVQIQSEEGVGTKVVITLSFDIDLSVPDPTAMAKPVATVSLAGMHALLVEDNELNLEIAHILLEDLGVIVTEARNGQEAVDTFAASKVGHFDLIFMDMMMPVMDGLEATRCIRKLDRPDARKVYILAMTANAFNEDRRECFAAGMDAHISKPIDEASITEAVASLAGRPS